MAYQHLWTPITELANAKSVVTITYWDQTTVPGASYQLINGSVRLSLPTAGRYTARIRTNSTEEAVTFDVTDRGDNAPEPIALGVLWAGYAIRQATPVGVVVLGSSTPNGGDQAYGNRWFTKLITSMQSAFPSGRGSESTVTTTLSRNSTTGIHGYNAAVGGTTSVNYLSDTKVADIGVVNPMAVLHMVGSNDMSINLHPSAYKQNLSKWLDKLDAAISSPHVHVMIHAHQRGGSYTHPWSDYRDALKELSIERTNVAFIDTEPTFNAARVPTPDTFNLLKSDNTHLETAGHELMYRLVADSLHVPSGNISITQNTTNATVTARDTTTVLSDSFNNNGSDSANILGRPFDNLLGGAYSKTWAHHNTNQIGIVNGRLTRVQTGFSFFAGVEMPVPDYELSFTLSAMPTAADLYVDVRRAFGTVDNSPNAYRLVFNGAGIMSLAKRVSGTMTTLAPAGNIVAGDRIALRVKGSTLTAYVNNAQVTQVTDSSIQAAGFAGFSGASDVNTFQVDNLVVSAVL